MKNENLKNRDASIVEEIQKKAQNLADAGRAEEGLALFEKAVKEHPGNEALLNFGTLYLITEKEQLDDFGQHFKDWLAVSAEQGREDAALTLSSLILMQEGKKEAKEVLPFLEKAALFKDKEIAREAACRLGEIYLLHVFDDVPVDEEKARAWLEKAADLGSGRGMYLLSRFYEELSSQPDKKKSDEWLQKAVDAGNGDACYDMASECIVEAGFHVGSQKIKALRKAVPFLKKGAENGDDECCLMLGMFYLNGTGIKRDTKKGLDLIEEAAALGLPEAMMYLAQLYRGELPRVPVKKNPAKAAFWLKKAASAGNMYAGENLGLSYILGEGVKKDPEKGMQYLENALQDGSSWAGLMMAAVYMGRDGIPQNLLKVEEYLRRTIFMNGPASDEAGKMLNRLKNKDWAAIPSLRNISARRTEEENEGPADGFGLLPGRY